MKLKILRYFLIFLILIPQLLYSQRVGLVLSGGSVRGIAHIGVIKALEEKGIPIDYIAGTSMGAVIASLYAMGYSPDEIYEFAISEDFNNVVSTKSPDYYSYYFKQKEITPELISIKISLKDSTTAIIKNFLPQSLTDPNPMNYILMKCYSSDQVKCNGDFNKLFIPFRCIVSDVYGKKALIMRNGDLADAVRASMTFPFVFKPIEIDGKLVLDGGIYNNFPADVMEEDFAPDFIIGSSVARMAKKNENMSIYNQLESIIVQKTNYSIDENKGAMLNINLRDISLFDFSNVEYIFNKGYEKGIEFADSLAKRIDRKVSQESLELKRQQYNSSKPKLVFDSYNVSGGTVNQNLYISKMFRTPEKDGTTCDIVKEDFYKILSDNSISELGLKATYSPEREKYSLNVKALMEKNLKLSVGGFITTMNANQIYLGGLYRQLSNYSCELSVDGEIGRTYNGVKASAKFFTPTSIPLYFQLLYVLQLSKFYDYESYIYSGENPSFIDESESYVKLNIGFPMLNKCKGIISAGYGYMNNKYFSSLDYNPASSSKERQWNKLFRCSFIIDRNSLNHSIYPMYGSRFYFKAGFYTGSNHWKNFPFNNEGDYISSYTNWLQLLLDWEKYYNISRRFKLGTKLQGSISTRPNTVNYLTSLILSPGFSPTPHSKTVFNSDFHSPKYIALGALPILKFTNSLYLKNETYCFLPINKLYQENGMIKKRELFSSCSVLSEMTLVYSLPITTISLFGNYSSNKKLGWSFGLNIGYFIRFPSFY